MQLKRGINEAIGRYQKAADRRWRIPPTFTVLPATGEPVVYYLSPAENSPSGGVKVIYRHVEFLNEMGIRSAVLHKESNFSCTWFEHRAPVVSADSIQFRQNDILVVPECYGPGMDKLLPDVRKIVFNQGAHHTFDRVDLVPGAPGEPYRSLQNLEGILTVSADGAELLRYAFPEVEISVARNVVDPTIFKLRDKRAPKRISYVPSRRTDELDQLLHVLHANGALAEGGWTIEPLSGLPESGMGNALRETSIFMSLSDRDGFGLPPAEAMATGCYVVGYSGGGGNEYFDSSYATKVTDSTGMIRGLLAALSMTDDEREELGARASARIHGYYNQEGLRADLEQFYGRLL